jgi:hypothetical protein
MLLVVEPEREPERCATSTHRAEELNKRRQFSKGRREQHADEIWIARCKLRVQCGFQKLNHSHGCGGAREEMELRHWVKE